jgi:hypothetical protein
MVSHNMEAPGPAKHAVAAFVTVIRVTNGAELRGALRQHERPVLIGGPEIAQLFRVYLAVQRYWLLAALMARAISYRYSADFKRTEWHVDKDVSQYEIQLTPTAP